MPGRSRLLGQTVLARHAAPLRAGGLRLAQSVVAARTPERIVETSTRLARGRSIGRAAAAPPAAPEIPRPPGMSEFAARWIFGDGPPEGIPLHGEAALASISTGERPSFLAEQDAREAQIAAAQAAFRAQPVVRGQVQEASASGFKLARKPVERPRATTEEPAPPAPTTSERIVEELRPASMAPPLPPPEAPASGPKADQPTTPEPRSSAPPPAEPPLPVAATSPAPEVREAPAPPAAGGFATPAEPEVAPARPKLTVARAEAPSRPRRPALQVVRTPAPTPGPAPAPRAQEPQAEPPAPAEPSPGLLRRVVDTVLRREPASHPPPQAAGAPSVEAEAAGAEAPLPATVAQVEPALDPAPRRFSRVLGRTPELGEPPGPTPSPEPATFTQETPGAGQEAPAPTQEGPRPDPTLVPAGAAGPAEAPPPDQPALDEPTTGAGTEPASDDSHRPPVPLELVDATPDTAGGTPASAPYGSTSSAPGAAPEGSSDARGTPPASPGGTSADEPAARAATASAPPPSTLGAPAVPVPDLPGGDEQAAPVARAPLSVSRSPLRSAAARLFGRRPPQDGADRAEPNPAPSAPPAVPAAPAAAAGPAAAQAPGAPRTVAAPADARAGAPASSTSSPRTLVQRVRAATAQSDVSQGDIAQSDISQSEISPSSVSQSDVPHTDVSERPIADVGAFGNNASETPVTVSGPARAIASGRETVTLRATQGRPAATATVPTARRSAVPAPESLRAERPPLRLVSSPSQPAAARALARSTEPGGAGQSEAGLARRDSPTSGARLAAATGAAYSSDPGGFETVVFPGPSGAQASSGMLSRAASDAANDNSPADQAPATASSPATPPPAPSGGGGDIEEIYDQVIERLRRDLLADRERMGDVLGDLP